MILRIKINQMILTINNLMFGCSNFMIIEWK